MEKAAFVQRFRESIRPALCWDRLMAVEWNVVETLFRLPVGASLVFTPWCCDNSGEPCAWNAPNAKPLTLADCTGRPEVLKANMVRPFDESEAQLRVVPAYQLPDGQALLLDATHRMVSATVAAARLNVAAALIEGPIDDRVLPDLRHWARPSTVGIFPA